MVLVILYVSSFVVQLYFLYPGSLEEINNFYVPQGILCVSSFHQDLVILAWFEVILPPNLVLKAG